jgi:hypothetical protein
MQPFRLRLEERFTALGFLSVSTRKTANEFGKSLETRPSRTQSDTVGPNEQSGRQSLAIIWFSCRELPKITGIAERCKFQGEKS